MADDALLREALQLLKRAIGELTLPRTNGRIYTDIAEFILRAEGRPIPPPRSYADDLAAIALARKP